MKGLFVVCFVLVWCDVVYCTKVVFGFDMIYKVPKLVNSVYLPFIYEYVHLFAFCWLLQSGNESHKKRI